LVTMARDLQSRFLFVLIAVLSVTAVVFAWINFQKDRTTFNPTDGVWWAENAKHVEARRGDINGPGAKAGVKVGDQLVAMDGREVTNVGSQVRQMYRAGVWTKTTYSLVRQGIPVEAPLILVPEDRSLYNGLRIIALVYLGVGLYVLLRRWTAPKSTHFYIFCLVSFVYYSFHYTGKFNSFDSIVYWSNVVAGVLQPALLLHFAMAFPEKKKFLVKWPWLVSLFYVPAAVLVAIQVMAVVVWDFTESLRWNLDRLQMLYQTLYFVSAAAILWASYRKAYIPIVRQQMKWISRGAVLAIAPYPLFYVIPYLQGTLATPAMKISAFSLVFLPLTFGYAILRYRLMDVDIIFKRGVAYTLATAAIVGV